MPGTDCGHSSLREREREREIVCVCMCACVRACVEGRKEDFKVVLTTAVFSDARRMHFVCVFASRNNEGSASASAMTSQSSMPSVPFPGPCWRGRACGRERVVAGVYGDRCAWCCVRVCVVRAWRGSAAALGELRGEARAFPSRVLDLVWSGRRVPQWLPGQARSGARSARGRAAVLSVGAHLPQAPAPRPQRTPRPPRSITSNRGSAAASLTRAALHRHRHLESPPPPPPPLLLLLLLPPVWAPCLAAAACSAPCSVTTLCPWCYSRRPTMAPQ